MSNTELRRILTSTFPEECAAVGPSALNDLLSGTGGLVPPEEGRPFPIMETLEFLKEVLKNLVIRLLNHMITKGETF